MAKKMFDKHEETSKHLSDLIKFVEDNCGDKSKLSQKDIANRIGQPDSYLSREKNAKNLDASLRKCEELIRSIKSAYSIAEDEELGFYFSSLSENGELATLATKLAINLIDVSTYFEEELRPHKQILARPEEALEERRKNNRRERFIVVTGAGASHAATKKVMPLAAEGAKKVRDYIKDKNQSLDDLISQEIKRLSLIYRLDPDDFETVLLACSKYAPNEVLDCLGSLLGLQYLPSLIYDIIAHMFKHRFIDAIINFNFDEILDNAITEEIGSGEIKMIFSDGDCPNKYDDLLTANRLKQPVYVKPHGTISHKGSLRFTREAYFDIPVKMKDTLYQLIEGQVEVKNQAQLKTNLIIIGFGLQSFEFTETIREYFSKNPNEEITFWVFDVSRHNVDRFAKDMEGRIKNENIHFFDLNRYSLEEHLKELWKLTEASFKPDYRPKGIENHLLVNHICDFDYKKIDRLNKSTDAQRKYFQARLYLEIIISLLQSDGILNTKQLVEDRAGKYLNLYRKHAVADEAASFRVVLERLGLVPYKGIARDTFTLKKTALFYADFQQLAKELYEAMNSTLPASYRPKQGHYASEFEGFIRYAETLKRRHLLKITSNFEYPHNHLFSGLAAEHILYTSIAWTYRYRDFLCDPQNDWDLMLAISESGRFLRPNDIEGKRLELILASADLPGIKGLGSLEEGYEHQCLSGKLLYMPWWLHNQHLILCLKRTAQKGKNWDDKWTLCGGFYYRSSLLSRRVNPVHLSNSADKKTLLYIFANYWYRAKSYTEQLEKEDLKSIPIVQDEIQLNAIIEELLGLYNANE